MHAAGGHAWFECLLCSQRLVVIAEEAFLLLFCALGHAMLVLTLCMLTPVIEAQHSIHDSMLRPVSQECLSLQIQKLHLLVVS